jgi:hypothetical protein
MTVMDSVKTSNVLQRRVCTEIERIFWRKSDSVRESRKIQTYASTQSQDEAEEMGKRLEKLCQIIPSCCMHVKVVLASGFSFQVPIQSSFICALDEFGEPVKSNTTMADVKLKIEEVSGVHASSQVLYSENQDIELGDDESVEDCGLCNGQLLFLIVDTDRLYWHRHKMIVRRYKDVIIQVVRKMPEIVNQDEDLQSQAGRPRLIEFLKHCRKTLGFMLERSASHKTRDQKDLDQTERFLTSMVIPIYNATCVCSSCP